MQSNKSAKFLLITGLVALALLSWVFYSSIEFYDEIEKTSRSLKAQQNPYLAAQQFMQKSGINSIEADSLNRLDSLDGIGTLLITDANQVVNPRQLEQVLKWLEKGGNLIVTANVVENSDDLLLDKFKVDVQWNNEYSDASDEGEDEDAESNTLTADDNKEEIEQDTPSISEAFRDYNRQIDEGKSPDEITLQKTSEDSLTTIDFGDETGKLEIQFNSRRVLTHPYIDDQEYDEFAPQPFSWSSSEYGIHMMQFQVSSGLLTIISDPTIWTSRRIDEYDHAYLLWVLNSRDAGFAILHPSLRDSIWRLMWQNASELLFALTVLLALWLWYLGHRFGRMVSRDSSGGRALSEHFSATANYLWQRKANDQLLEPLRQQVHRRASNIVIGYASADSDPDRQIELLSEHCNIDSTMVDSALKASEFNETSFVRTVKLLKNIEQSL